MNNEIVDPSIVKSEITAYMGNVIAEAQQVALAVQDDASANLATNLGVAIKSKLVWLKEKRKEVYEPLMHATERVREEYDQPIKLGLALEKTLSAAVNKYSLDKKREEERLRLAAEAQARIVREEAARKAREAEAERQRIIKEQEERERQRKAAVEAEERRKLAEIKAKEDAERARIQREQDERAQRIKEEEDARLAKAQEAHDVGLGERVQDILEKPTAIAEIAKALPTQAEVAAEIERKKQAVAAEAEAERKRQEAAAEETRLREAEGARMKQMQEDAARAKADADLAEASAAARASVTQADSRMRTSVNAKYEIPDTASFLKVALAVAQGRVPIEFLGFNPAAPEKFRSPAIGAYATKIKGDPEFSAKQAELAAVGIRVWLEETATFKAEVA